MKKIKINADFFVNNRKKFVEKMDTGSLAIFHLKRRRLRS
jgi:hypothetical protein